MLSPAAALTLAMKIYIDETVHEQIGFLILAYVICKSDPQSDMDQILEFYKKDEFHSLEKMDGNNQAQKLRNRIRSYVNSNCRWGIFVLPIEARWELSKELHPFLSELVRSITRFDEISVYIDEGIIKGSDVKKLKEITGIEQFELCKSHEIKGIQLADLVAALCGVRLREEISQKPKMLWFGNESGFDPPIEAELGYELWASLRYSMHHSPVPFDQDKPEIPEFSTKGYGLFISDRCSIKLREAAEKIFGRIYLGCIH